MDFDTEKLFPPIRAVFGSFFAPKALFSKTLSVCHFSLSFPFPSVFPLNVPCFFLFVFINPFSDNILVLFRWLYLCCPFAFFVSASFLPTSFLQSPSPIHLAFILVVWLFYSSCLHDIVFRLGVSFFVFLFGSCLVFF